MIANLLNYIVWDPDPILAHLGPMTIRYYSTCWMIGLLLGYLLMSKLYKQQGLSDEKFSPLFLYIFFGVLIGGRLGHCIFYQPEYFLTQWDHFIEMLIPVHHMPDGSWKFTGYEGYSHPEHPDYFLLSQSASSPMDPRTFQNHYQRILSQAGLRYLNFHAIRHTFATRCITNGMDPKTLSEILGHSDLKVTLEYYFHSSLEFKKEQIDRLTALSPAVHTSLPDMPHNMTD